MVESKFFGDVVEKQKWVQVSVQDVRETIQKLQEIYQRNGYPSWLRNPEFDFSY